MTGNCSHAAAAAACTAAAAAAAELVSWNCLAAAAPSSPSVEMASAAAAAVFETVACEVGNGDGTTAEIKSLLPSGCRFAGEEATAAAITEGEEEEGAAAAATASLFLFILRFLVWMLSFLRVMGRGHCNRERARKVKIRE